MHVDALFRTGERVKKYEKYRCGVVLGVILLLGAAPVVASERQAPSGLERSFWLHASLAPVAQRGYWGPDYPTCEAPAERGIEQAAKMLAGAYTANRLYLIYHHEIPRAEAERVFTQWRRHCPAEVEIVPTLVLRMYDERQSPVFTPEELARLIRFLREAVNAQRLAVYDVYAQRDQGAALAYLAAQYPRGLIRVGIQPEEPIHPPFVAAVQDTWSGFCHGKTHADWKDAGFGAESLRRWVEARNEQGVRVAWDLIAVAWDYSATERGGYPGYDDAAKNMPLPAGRNELAVAEIRNVAHAEGLAGFSADLLILQANSLVRDGRPDSFYQTLQRGQPYRGYYSEPFQEIARIFQQLRTEAQDE